MYAVSKEYLDNIYKGSRRIKMKILINNVEIDENEVVEWSIESHYSNNGVPGIGGVVASKLSLKAIRTKRMPEFVAGQAIKPYIAIEEANGTYNWMPLGVFNPDLSSATKKDAVVEIDCYDKLISYESIAPELTISYPILATEYITAVNKTYNTSIINTGVQGVIQEPYENLNLRQILSEIAELSGMNVRCDREGWIRFVRLGGVENLQTLTADNYIDFSLTSDDIVKIDGLITKEYKTGACSSYQLEFDNPDVTTQKQLDEVYSRSRLPVNYYAYELESQGFPHFDIGDRINLVDVKNVKRELLLLNHNLKYNGGLKSEFSADVPAEITTQTGSNGDKNLSESMNTTIKSKGTVMYGLEQHMPVGKVPTMTTNPATINLNGFQEFKHQPNNEGYQYFKANACDYKRKTRYQLKHENNNSKTTSWKLMIGTTESKSVTEVLIDTITTTASSAPNYYSHHYQSLDIKDDILYMYYQTQIYARDANRYTTGGNYVAKLARYNIATGALLGTQVIEEHTLGSGYSTFYEGVDSDILAHTFKKGEGGEESFLYLTSSYTICRGDYSTTTRLLKFNLSKDSNSCQLVKEVPFFAKNAMELKGTRSYLFVIMRGQIEVDGQSNNEYQYAFHQFDSSLINSTKYIRNYITDSENNVGNADREIYGLSLYNAFVNYKENTIYFIEEKDPQGGVSSYRICTYQSSTFTKRIDNIENIVEREQYSSLGAAFVDDSGNVILIGEDFYHEKLLFTIFEGTKNSNVAFTSKFYSSYAWGSYNTDHFISSMMYNPLTREVYIYSTDDQHFMESSGGNVLYARLGFACPDETQLYWAYDTKRFFIKINDGFVPFINGSDYPVPPNLGLPYNHPEYEQMRPRPVEPDWFGESSSNRIIRIVDRREIKEAKYSCELES